MEPWGTRDELLMIHGWATGKVGRDRSNAPFVCRFVALTSYLWVAETGGILQADRDWGVIDKWRVISYARAALIALRRREPIPKPAAWFKESTP